MFLKNKCVSMSLRYAKHIPDKPGPHVETFPQETWGGGATQRKRG